MFEEYEAYRIVHRRLLSSYKGLELRLSAGDLKETFLQGNASNVVYMFVFQKSILGYEQDVGKFWRKTLISYILQMACQCVQSDECVFVLHLPHEKV